MIFKCKEHLTWDTWVYYYNGVYYAYYLITDISPGEGFGVAVSTDGIHFEDKGICISASDKMVFYLGTGAIWKSPYFEQDKLFLCNYSEWRKDEETGLNVQNIFFAKSTDLIHWEKLGEENIFKIDESFYKKYELDGGRWDCIFPYIENGKYHGFFTATPKDYFGCGYAVSENGINWMAQKPPKFQIEEKGIYEGIECGATCKYKDKYYILMGTYVNEYGMAVLTSDKINGVYKPQEKNFALLANRSFRHAYFMRFFEKDGQLLVNHHCISREENKYFRPTTLLSPFKLVDFDEEGILRLKWFKNNNLLKGKNIDTFENKAFFAQGITNKRIEIKGDKNETLSFAIDRSKGKVTILCNGAVVEEIDRAIDFTTGNFILLCRDGFIELYIDDWFITCYTLDFNLKEVCSDTNINIFELSI